MNPLSFLGPRAISDIALSGSFLTNPAKISWIPSSDPEHFAGSALPLPVFEHDRVLTDFPKRSGLGDPTQDTRIDLNSTSLPYPGAAPRHHRSKQESKP